MQYTKHIVRMSYDIFYTAIIGLNGFVSLWVGPPKAPHAMSCMHTTCIACFTFFIRTVLEGSGRIPGTTDYKTAPRTYNT
jgi:hypothetical protein